MLKYEEIIEYIKNSIKTEKLDHPKKLPSIRFIQNLFHCSAGTVLKAYTKLEQDHIIYSVPKSGYYIINDFHDKSSSKHPIIDFSAVNLNVESFPYKNFQHCLNKSIDLYKEKLFTYSDPRGLKSLITVLSKHIQSYQIFTKSDNIIITSSSQQVLNILSTMPFPNGKSNILVEQPTYYGMIKYLELNNIPVLGINRDFNGIDLDELEKLFKYGNIKFFYTIPRFHNPTGTSYSKQEKQEIIKLAAKYDVYIVEDDIAADLDMNKKNDPMFSYDTSSKVIYLKSYSKVLMPGLRVAALILPELLINKFLEYKRWTDISSPILSQGALEIYIKNGMFDAHMKHLVSLYANRVHSLKSTLLENKHPRINYNIPDSGYFGCLYINGSLKYDKVITELQHKNIKIFDTSECFLKEYKCNNYFRLTISEVNEKQIVKNIPILLEVLNKYID
ncbi:aminotransferase-like domain-containing protein [Clostridium diolis]|uniref:GntR family transcriptional regulator n=1 Tax=Clostridium diolis TaxID=223919 RepID=A0AAV3W9E9_9CLOT|nr:PLP-dependent aminotransferase family protein [Clostridium diolis]QES73412.1 PLP-dependent aminotransferase family protein [Clostridium diolis]GEA33684.1 GntR family transcriptional regulator [Clostridium diolis]